MYEEGQAFGSLTSVSNIGPCNTRDQAESSTLQTNSTNQNQDTQEIPVKESISIVNQKNRRKPLMVIDQVPEALVEVPTHISTAEI